MDTILSTINQARGSAPALRAFTLDNPAPTDFCQGGYLGTIYSDADIIAEARQIADLRRAAAVAGGYARTTHTVGEELKGAAGELFVRAAYQGVAGVTFSELVLDRPDPRPDLCICAPEGLADLISDELVDIKTTCELWAGLQARGDNYFMLKAAELEKYSEAGVRGILFVHVVSGHCAHLAYASCAYIRRHWRLSEAGEKLTPRYAAYVRAIDGVVPRHS